MPLDPFCFITSDTTAASEPAGCGYEGIDAREEELLYASYEIAARDEDDWNLAPFGGQSALPDPQIKVDVLSRLYFRRLRKEATAVTAVANQLATLATKVRSAVTRRAVALNGETNEAEVAAIHENFLAEFNQLGSERVKLWPSLLDARAILLGRAGEVINEVVGDIALAIDYAPFFAEASRRKQSDPSKGDDGSDSKS